MSRFVFFYDELLESDSLLSQANECRKRNLDIYIYHTKSWFSTGLKAKLEAKGLIPNSNEDYDWYKLTKILYYNDRVISNKLIASADNKRENYDVNGLVNSLIGEVRNARKRIQDATDGNVTDYINFLIKNKSMGIEDKKISDGYHTFEELYEYRKAYNALFANLAVDKFKVEKTKNHYDGEPCFGGTHFKVYFQLPTGEVSNHYKLEDWDLFDVPEVEKATIEYDGHTPAEALQRMLDYLKTKKDESTSSKTKGKK